MHNHYISLEYSPTNKTDDGYTEKSTTFETTHRSTPNTDMLRLSVRTSHQQRTCEKGIAILHTLMDFIFDRFPNFLKKLSLFYQ